MNLRVAEPDFLDEKKLSSMKNLVINFLKLSNIKVYVICNTPTEISYLGKIWFLRYGLNALGQSDCTIFKSNISLEQNEIARFFEM